MVMAHFATANFRFLALGFVQKESWDKSQCNEMPKVATGNLAQRLFAPQGLASVARMSNSRVWPNSSRGRSRGDCEDLPRRRIPLW